jgi:hypothetical protein
MALWYLSVIGDKKGELNKSSTRGLLYFVRSADGIKVA